MGKTDNIWLIAIGFLIAVSAFISGIKVVKDISLSQARFNASFFGMMFFKMILAFILIILYLKFSGFANKLGVIFIVCSYFIYTCFEIQFILHKLRTNSEKIQNADNARK